MTNKLLIVIEDARCRLIATQQKQETDYVHIVDVHHHVKETVLELLDAIIEEIEEQAKTIKQHIDEMKKLNYTEQDIDFNRGKTMYAIDLSQSLKQSREELSTSLTQ